MTTATTMKAGDEMHVAGHESVLDGLNGFVLNDDGAEVWFVTAHGNESTIVPNGSRHVLSRECIREGMKPLTEEEWASRRERDKALGIPSRYVKEDWPG